MENPKSEKTGKDPNLVSTDPDVTTASEPELAPPTEPAPEPKPKASTPEPDVKVCKFSAEGTFDKGVADCELKKSSTLEIERTQILILVKDGRRYTYSRTNIE